MLQYKKCESVISARAEGDVFKYTWEFWVTERVGMRWTASPYKDIATVCVRV